MRAANISRHPVWRDPWVLAALAVALALRLAMARGGLWLDEAWSAVMAHDAASPIAVITGIHHDNNHPLNSWWLQLVGLDAPPLLARALAISCSVATILPAASFASRRSALAGRLAALLFALSPMLVLLGSEARGYAPMLLALACLIDQVDPLAERARSPALMVATGLLGTLGHLLMLPAILLVSLWLAIDARSGGRRATLEAIARIRPALTASLIVVALLVGWAYAVQGGLTIGSRTPFSAAGFVGALIELARLTLGAAWLAPLAMVLLIGARPARRDLPLWALLGLGVPLAALIFHPANGHISRYYLLATPALLWLVAEGAGTFLAGGRAARSFAGLLVTTVLASMTVTDLGLLTSRRGDPAFPVLQVAADHPRSATILIAASRLSAVITVAAAERRLGVRAVGPPCAPADALLIDLEDRPPRPQLDHCAVRWTLADFRLRPYRDGAGWALYDRAGLPPPGPVANGPRPAR